MIKTLIIYSLLRNGKAGFQNVRSHVVVKKTRTSVRKVRLISRQQRHIHQENGRGMKTKAIEKTNYHVLKKTSSFRIPEADQKFCLWRKRKSVCRLLRRFRRLQKFRKLWNPVPLPLIIRWPLCVPHVFWGLRKHRSFTETFHIRWQFHPNILRQLKLKDKQKIH